jgi:2,4-dienoyl-CoA reductase-like NADH-dependent reductase (Old Yellow Enzyme family)/thioredoxin reductase
MVDGHVTALRHILAPITINRLEIKNRVVRTAHGTNLGGGTLSDDLIAYHAARARGGVGLSMLEASGIHPSGPMTLNAWDDSIIPRYEALMRAVRPHGMRVFSQLNHLGSELGKAGERPWSASELVSPGSGLLAHAMTVGEIQALVHAFAAAARRAVEGGLDGIEVHCAHGYLIQQFLSPHTNRREDDYGGHFENRMRFYLEVLRAVREAIGPHVPLGTRVGPHNRVGGLNLDEHREIVPRVLREGLVDYLNVSHGSHENPHKIIGAMHEPTGYELAHSAPLTRLTKLPTVVTGRFRTLADAEQIVAEGIADLVGMTRAHIADPDIVRKTLAGRSAEIRPCIGCNQGCVGGLAAGRLGCTVNVAAGRELQLAEELIEQVARARRVLVVGGGPAGMEAARVAALRGHRVTLAEAGDALGGTLRFARLAPNHAGIGDIADWLARELTRLGVDVILGRRVDRAFVRRFAPDAVVVATGASPRLDGRQQHQPERTVAGVELAHVFTTQQLVQGQRDWAGACALVFDDVGAYEAIGAAEFLVAHGALVTFATSQSSFAPRMAPALVAQPALERLRGSGRFTLRTRSRLDAIAPGSVVLGGADGSEREDVRADAVVLVTLNRPNRDIADAASELGLPLHVVGDARHPEFLPAAIAQGHEAGRAI